MKISPFLLAAIGGLSLCGCSTYVEDVASEQFSPVFEEIQLTADNTRKTGGIYQSGQNGCFPLTNVQAGRRYSDC